jgi:hypothetical protein
MRGLGNRRITRTLGSTLSVAEILRTAAYRRDGALALRMSASFRGLRYFSRNSGLSRLKVSRLKVARSPVE